jgi:hypothetical protein
MSFYTIQYKIAVNLELSEPLEIKRSEKFIEKIVLETVQENSKTFLLITFFIPKEAYENCKYEDIPTFLDIQQEERDKFFDPQQGFKLLAGSERIKINLATKEHIEAIKRHILLDKVAQLKNWILNFLFFHFEISPVEMTRITTDIPEKFIVYSPVCVSSNQWAHLLSESMLEGIKLEIFKEQLQIRSMSSIYAFFYDVHKNTELDSVSKFVIFYGMLQEILEALYGEIDQKKTDDFIVKHLGCQRNYHRIVRRIKIPVTAITYYRNEVAHPVSLGNINQEFRNVITDLTLDLEKLIRQAGLELSIHHRELYATLYSTI